MTDICLECGVAAVKPDGTRWCERYKVVVGIPETKRKSCTYFFEFQYDDGELLSPLQHLYLVENQVNSRHMRGPV